jgi:hypothetical protein
MTALDLVSAFISSTYSTPIKCPGCGEHAHLMHRQGFAAGAELRTFECVTCNRQTDLIVTA